MAFNPIKEDPQGKYGDIVWTTAILDETLKGLEKGKRLKANPFYKNNTHLLKGDLVFKRTAEEIKEWQHCKNDIIYFTNKYCKVMTPTGIQNITLRDYQVDYLRHLEKNRLSILLAARQAGKCIFLLSTVDIRDKNSGNCPLVSKSSLQNYYIKESDTYKLPVYELYNLYDHSFKWKIEYHLYKIIDRILCHKNERRQRRKINGKQLSSTSNEIPTRPGKSVKP